MSRYSAKPWRDVGAGLCVAGLLLPEAVAYAGIAHLSVVHAFMAAAVGLLVYALWGGSRFAVVAPTSSTAALVAAAAGTVASASGGGAAYTQVVVAMVLVSGAMLLALAWLKQGQLSSFISRPVLKAFAFALAITIVIKQLPDALGLALPPGVSHDTLQLLYYVLTHVAEWHGLSLAIAVASIALVMALRRVPRWPASLLVVVGGVVLAYGADLQSHGVQAVGHIAPMALQLQLPMLNNAEWLRCAELAFGLVMLIFAESWGSVRSMALAYGDPVDANRELWVLGACNLGSAVLQGMPVGAGFSATSANATAGAVSRLSGVVALVAVLLVWGLGLDALALLPRPVLAAAVISALWHSLSWKPLVQLWKMDRDRISLVAAGLGVLLLGVLDGMLAAVGVSLLMALNRFSTPVVHALGELDHSRNFVDLQAHPEAAPAPGLLVLRPEEPLFFASAERVGTEVLKLVKQRPDVHTVILSLEESGDLDSTALDCLLELDRALQSDGRDLRLARVKTTVRHLLAAWDADGLGREGRIFWSVADAVAAQPPER